MFGVGRVFLNGFGHAYEGVYIMSIGDCAKQFLHIIRLYKANGNQLEIIDYHEDDINRIQIMVMNHFNGEYFLVTNITPRTYA